ncbi:MAG TPA: hypothetical protein PLC59_00655 [Bacteroidales bacterium]|nr:hypothetical protein [Bacteroidales bacterium]
MKKYYSIFLKWKWYQKLFFFFLVFFPFRLLYGITSEFWFEDELQIFLIGLKFYSTGEWPYFGPDIVYTSSQIPGALQGLLVGLPFNVIPIPEAPFILLNILSFFSLFFLGYYIVNYHCIKVPEWFLWCWIFLAPWVMNLSTHVINPSYVLPAAIIFFISFFEIIPSTQKNMIKKPLSFFLLGFATLFIFQLHMSVVLLFPFIAVAFYFTIIKEKRKKIISIFFFFIVGCIIGALTLIPTFVKYGIFDGNASSNIVFNPTNLKEILTVFIRILSFASFEVARFLGSNTTERLHFATTYYWSIPFIIIVSLVGIAQVCWMIIYGFKKTNDRCWKTIKVVLLISIILTYFSFFFSVKGPSSHTYYLLLPLVMIYSFYCWEHIMHLKWIKKISIIFLFSTLIFHVAVGINNFKNKSFYINRGKVVKAIQLKQYNILGERRIYDRN